MRNKLSCLATVGLLLSVPSGGLLAEPSAEQALTLQPVQADVDFEKPSGEAVKKCKVEAVQGGGSGWVVRGESGQILRQFLDTNNDKKLDQWSYFKDGLEVYRDIDENFNGKADQYRWLGTAGTRWGLDGDEDGRIDRWKMLSAEETTAEVVAALRERDVERLRRLLLTAAELDGLGLGAGLKQEIQERLTTTRDGIEALLKSQKMVASNAKWLHFGATRPGAVPAGTDGSTKDLIAYDNAAAIIDTDGKHSQVSVGTLLRVDEGWRIIDLPKSESSTGFFYASLERVSDVVEPAAGGLSEEVQGLLESLEKIDQQLSSTTDAAMLAKLNEQRADALARMSKHAATAEERATWIKQFADSVSAAIQAGQYPSGLKRLDAMLSELAQDQGAVALLPYVKFHYLTAEYGQKLQTPNADFSKIQEQWVKDLETFAKAYPQSESAPEAMLQLAIAQEFAGEEADAKQWYGKVVSDFPSTPMAQKAAGAKRRLESVGQSLSFRGPTLDGRTVDLASYQGKVVLLHYWATWCEPCKEDLKAIKALQAKLGTRGFTPIGVNLDNDAKLLKDYASKTSLPWPQLHEAGGLDSRLANELGILTLPTMLLIDKTGRVVRRNIHVGELEGEVERLLK